MDSFSGSKREPLGLEYINEFGVWLSGVEIPSPDGFIDGEVTETLSEDDLKRDFAATPGLFYEAVRGDGIPVWKISCHLRPGNPLHDQFLLGRFTTEQHWELIRTCKVVTIREHGALLILLGDIIYNFELHNDCFARGETLVERKARFLEAQKVLRRAENVLEKEPRIEELLNQLGSKMPDGLDPILIAKLDGKLRSVLRFLADEFANLAANEEEFRDFHFNGLPEFDYTKSAERQYIWEPFLIFWAAQGHKVGYSQNGPILNAIRIIHTAFEIEPPKPTSLRQVINDFNGKPRATKRAPTKRSS